MSNHSYILNQLSVVIQSAYISTNKKFLIAPSKNHDFWYINSTIFWIWYKGSANFRENFCSEFLQFMLFYTAWFRIYKNCGKFPIIREIIWYRTSFKLNLQLKIDYLEALYFLTEDDWADRKKSYNRSHLWRINWGGSRSKFHLHLGTFLC